MSKLTHGDIAELTAFFGSPLTAGYRSCIAAQSYEPRGPGYDPSTDAKLARLVFDGVRHGKSDWARTKRVVDHLSDAHVEVLRVLCSGGSGAIAVRLPRALAAGRRLEEDRLREHHLQGLADRRDGASPMTIAIRVLEADRTYRPARTWETTALRAQHLAAEAIDAGLVDVSAAVDAIVSEITGAFHAARALAGEWRRATARREDQRREDFRASLRAGREAKESARFAKKLRGAA